MGKLTARVVFSRISPPRPAPNGATQAMDDQLTLRNFTDLLDPDALDRGKALSDGGHVRHIEKTDDGFWVAECTDGDTTHAPLVELGQGQRLPLWDCDCGQASEAEPCAHVAALLYTLKTNELQEKPAAKRGRPKAEPDSQPAGKAGKTKDKAAPKIVKNPKPKDAAEALLGELEPKEIFDFVRDLLAKNKDFKSQFLMRFSERDHANERKFDEIVANAISAVKGRRKYLKGADGAKIASALAPLGKQAAAAEAKGFFREAVAICTAFVEQMPPVFVAMETPSAKLESLFGKALDVLGLVAQNANTPFEFRQELFSTMLAKYRHLETTVSGDIVEQFYQHTLTAARSAKRLPELADGLRALIRSQMAGKKRNAWNSEIYWELRVVKQLYELYINELQDGLAAVKALEDHRANLLVYYNLIAAHLQSGDFAAAERHLDHLSKNVKSYGDQGSDWEIKQRIQRFYLELYQRNGNRKQLAETAGAMFEASNCRDFGLYEIEKSALEPEAWAKRVASYISKLGKNKAVYSWEMKPLLEVLTREERWEDLLQKLQQTQMLEYWLEYGTQLRDKLPSAFLEGARRVVGRAAEEANSGRYPLIAGLLEAMASTEGGSIIVIRYFGKFQRQVFWSAQYDEGVGRHGGIK